MRVAYSYSPRLHGLPVWMTCFLDPAVNFLQPVDELFKLV